MSDGSFAKMKRGAASVINGMATVYKDKAVRKTYRFILLGLFTLALGLNVAFGYAVWHFTQPAEDASVWMVGGLLLLRFLGWFTVLLISPLMAITTCNLLFPVFSEVPFLAGLKSLDRDRGTALEARPGLGAAASILNSLRRFGVFLLLSAGCFLLGFVPLVGPLVAPVLQFYFTARTVSWELMDPYFERVGLRLEDQKVVFRSYSSEFLGLGLVCGPLLSIPFLGPLLFGLVQAGAAQFVLDVFPQSDAAEDLLSTGKQ